MNESEMMVFCPKDVRIWEENCHNVQFLNFTAISETNELNLIKTFENSINSLLYGYLTTFQKDMDILHVYNGDGIEEGMGREGEEDEDEGENEVDNNRLGPIVISIVRLRSREKEMLLKTLEFLKDYEDKIRKGLVIFQLELKAKERIEANLREIEHQRFIDEVQKRVLIKPPLATLDVNLGENIPPRQIVLQMGQSLEGVVKTFCKLYSIGVTDEDVLIEALRKKVVSPVPSSLTIGVVVPSGERRILSIPEGSNIAIETNVFCAKHDIRDTDSCDAILNHVNNRLYPAFIRNIIITGEFL
jgi:hypothetical protein